MLLLRSISTLHACLILASITIAKSQYYNPDYEVTDDGHDTEHGSYRSEAEVDDRPDYSKYYTNEGSSAPLISSSFLGDTGGKETEGGFVTPLDFSGFFGSTQFGAATNQKQSLPVIAIQNPFHFQDALKKPNSSGFVDASDFGASFSNSPNFESEVGKQFNDNPFEQKTDNTFVAPHKSKNSKQSYKSEVDDLNSYEKPKKVKSYEKKKDYKLNNNYKYSPILPTLSTYTGAKINQLSPVKSYVPQYFPAPKLTNAPLSIHSTLAPYQKYNFQATSNLPILDNIKSTLPPLNTKPLPLNNYYSGPDDFVTPTEFAQPSEYKSQKVQNSNCQQIEKQLSPDDISHGRFKRQADKMNCYLCKDPKSGGTYEQCSFTSDPGDDQSYFRGHAEKYSTKSYVDPEEHSRNKRDTSRKTRRNKQKRDDDKEQTEEYVNPFNYEKDNEHKFNVKPREFDDSESYYQPPDFSHYEKDPENYRFGPEYFSDATTEDKSYSEIQSEKLKKNGDNCKKIKKDSMVCMICANPKTGGNYEQCSYSSEPNEKKYAYVKEKKFSSNDPPVERTVESSETKPKIQRHKSRFQKPKSAEYSASTKHPKQLDKEADDYYIPQHFLAETKQEKKKIKNYALQEEEFGDKNKNGEYVYKLFPEYAEKETQNREVKQRPGFEFKSDLPEYFTAEESKKDVDSVLQEFSKKDRSKCKKIAKDKMTCYLCVDNKGVQHEECMFVSESQPKSSHIAYHEVKEFSSDPKNQNEEVAADTKQTEIKTKKSPTKKASIPISLKDVDAEPTEFVKVVGKTPRIVRRKTNISKTYLPQESKKSEVKVRVPKAAQEEEKEEEKQEEVELEIEGPEGAYASDLVPLFSKKFGTALPKYMLEISEGEKIFDEVVGSG